MEGGRERPETCTCRCVDRQTETDTQTDRQTDRQQTCRHADTEDGGWTMLVPRLVQKSLKIHILACGCSGVTDRQTDRRTDRQTDRQTDRHQVDRLTHWY